MYKKHHGDRDSTKSYKALFPLWPLKKKHCEINKLTITQRKD